MKQNFKRLSIIIGALLLVAACGVFCWFLFSNANNETNQPPETIWGFVVGETYPITPEEKIYLSEEGSLEITFEGKPRKVIREPSYGKTIYEYDGVGGKDTILTITVFDDGKQSICFHKETD